MNSKECKELHNVNFNNYNFVHFLIINQVSFKKIFYLTKFQNQY